MSKAILPVVLALILVTPTMPVPHGSGADCFFSTSLESQLKPHSYIEGRAFFGTYIDRADALRHAQRIGACVVQKGYRVRDVEPILSWALGWEYVQGYAVMGWEVKHSGHDQYRFAWKDSVTNATHHSMWLTRSEIIPTDAVLRELNAAHAPRYRFWIELSI